MPDFIMAMVPGVQDILLQQVLDSHVIEMTAESQGRAEVQMAMEVGAKLRAGTLDWQEESAVPLKGGEEAAGSEKTLVMGYPDTSMEAECPLL